MDAESNNGTLIRVGRREDDQGRTVLEAVVHFYDGAAPEVKFDTIFKRLPVRIVSGVPVTTNES